MFQMLKTASRLLCCLLLLGASSTRAETVTLAVAANFTAAMKEIAAEFARSSGHRTRISYGSTGKLYAQILHGAPFDLFLAADQERPKRIEEQDQLGQQRFTYAIGKLVLWSAAEQPRIGERTLLDEDFQRLAIANPKTAPYGAAAEQVLDHLQLGSRLADRLVRGDSIAQTYQFVATGNAQFGLVALAQVALDDSGSHWLIPESWYDPLRQDAVLLNSGLENPAALAFIEFLRGRISQDIIRGYGYEVDAIEPGSDQTLAAH